MSLPTGLNPDQRAKRKADKKAQKEQKKKQGALRTGTQLISQTTPTTSDDRKEKKKSQQARQKQLLPGVTKKIIEVTMNRQLHSKKITPEGKNFSDCWGLTSVMRCVIPPRFVDGNTDATCSYHPNEVLFEVHERLMREPLVTDHLILLPPESYHVTLKPLEDSLEPFLRIAPSHLHDAFSLENSEKPTDERQSLMRFSQALLSSQTFFNEAFSSCFSNQQGALSGWLKVGQRQYDRCSLGVKLGDEATQKAFDQCESNVWKKHLSHMKGKPSAEQTAVGDKVMDDQASDAAASDPEDEPSEFKSQFLHLTVAYVSTSSSTSTSNVKEAQKKIDEVLKQVLVDHSERIHQFGRQNESAMRKLSKTKSRIDEFPVEVFSPEVCWYSSMKKFVPLVSYSDLQATSTTTTTAGGEGSEDCGECVDSKEVDRDEIAVTESYDADQATRNSLAETKPNDILGKQVLRAQDEVDNRHLAHLDLTAHGRTKALDDSTTKKEEAASSTPPE